MAIYETKIRKMAGEYRVRLYQNESPVKKLDITVKTKAEAEAAAKELLENAENQEIKTKAASYAEKEARAFVEKQMLELISARKNRIWKILEKARDKICPKFNDRVFKLIIDNDSFSITIQPPAHWSSACTVSGKKVCSWGLDIAAGSGGKQPGWSQKEHIEQQAQAMLLGVEILDELEKLDWSLWSSFENDVFEKKQEIMREKGFDV